MLYVGGGRENRREGRGAENAVNQGLYPVYARKLDHERVERDGRPGRSRRRACHRTTPRVEAISKPFAGCSNAVWSLDFTGFPGRAAQAVSGFEMASSLWITLGSLALGTEIVRDRGLSVGSHIVDASFPLTIRDKPAVR